MSEQNQTEPNKNAPAAGPSESTNKLVAPEPQAKTRLVKMEIMRDSEVNLPDGSKTILEKGAIVDLDEKEAIRLVNKTVKGTYGFTGERDGTPPLQTLRAARPWQTPRDVLAKENPLDPLNFQEGV